MSRGRQLTAIMTCHNRRASTLACIQSLAAQEDVDLDVRTVLVDDGSTDGTAPAVAARFPDIRLVPGDGTLFWAAGMALAERVALTEGDPDYLLWLNDDVRLSPGALRTLLTVSRDARPSLHAVSGSVRDPATGRTSYGGVRRLDWHPLRYQLATPGEQATEVDNVHGNVLLVPRLCYQALGAIDGGFEHAYADFDYGQRLRDRGGRLLLAPGHVGECSVNRRPRAALDPAVPRWRRLAAAMTRTEMPVRSQIRYLRRHGGAAWPVLAVAPYVRAGLLPGRYLRPRHARVS